LKVLAIISRDLEKGSTKYRLAQYREFLGSRGIEIEFVKRRSLDASILAKARRADVIFNQRCLFRYSLAKKLITESRRTVFDFDDAIYTRPGKPYSALTRFRVKRRLHLWLKCSDTVTLSSHFLAVYARQYSDSVEIIPMALDLEKWKPAEKNPENELTIGWAGAPVNIRLLEKLDTVLVSLVKKYPFLKLAVFSGEKPRLSCPFEYQPFLPGLETTFVQNLDIGLLPLIDEEFYRGKSPIKAIQYLACGVPVVGNIIGATREILNEKNSIAVSTQDEWFHALERLINNRDMIRSMGSAGREHVLSNNSFKLAAEQLLNVFSVNSPGLEG
jgi:glycosyltransferase involved in cell wall biosynthesis